MLILIDREMDEEKDRLKRKAEARRHG